MNKPNGPSVSPSRGVTPSYPGTGRKEWALAEVDSGGRSVGEGLMGSLVIVEREIAAETALRFAGMGIFGEIDLLVLDGAPQALGENVVVASATAIHADLHASAQQQLRWPWPMQIGRAHD